MENNRSDYDDISMPNINGLGLFQAIDILKNNGLRIKNLTYHENGSKKNSVLFQSIKPGHKIKSGTFIDLKVSGTNPIKYLPSIVQINDKNNNNFLERYLWIFHSILNSINIKLDNVHKFFNPLETPKDFFPWLASWFSISLDYAVSDKKMRLLVKEAIKLYQWRGTLIGISKFLEIITGIEPKIIEHDVPYKEYIILDNELVERPILGESNSLYNFVISFPVQADYFDIQTIKIINQIVKSEKPAHANYFIIFEPKKGKKVKTSFAIAKDMID